jgi:hypothetical protein
VIVENFAATLEQAGQHAGQAFVLCSMGDQLGLLKGALVNHVVRNVKKIVPPFNLPGAVRFNDALAQERGCSQAPGHQARRHCRASVHRRHDRCPAALCCCTNVIANVQSKPERSGHGSLGEESSLFMSARCRSTISSLSRST